MKKIILKGFHFSFLPIIKRVERLSYEVTFDKSAMYDLGSFDQFDWNKLIGVKANYFSPRKNSLMVGWRWNITKQCIQLTDYRHDSEGTALYNDNGILDIPLKDISKPFKIEIYEGFIEEEKHGAVIGICLRIIANNSKTKVERKFFDLPTLLKSSKWWVINSWFGGNRRAPQTIKIKIK